MRKLMTLSGLLGFALLLAVPMNAQAVPDSLTVTAFVENQVCMGGDFVQVTFSATATSTSNPVGFRWDFNNDGRFDTPRNTDSIGVRIYPDESRITSRVGAINQAGETAQNRIRFTTMECGN